MINVDAKHKPESEATEFGVGVDTQKAIKLLRHLIEEHRGNISSAELEWKTKRKGFLWLKRIEVPLVTINFK